jgi:hypothetical protein
MISIERLCRLALDEGEEEEVRAVEEHVLACGHCGGVLARLLAIGDGIASLLASGDLAIPVTPSLLRALEASGLVTRTYALAAGTTVPCGVSSDDVYVLTHLAADLHGVARVDLYTPRDVVRDVPFDASTGRVSFLARGEELRTLPSMQIPLRLVGVSDEGEERPLGEYTLSHTAFVRSPG